VQSIEEKHDTPRRSPAPDDPVGEIAQFVPCQRSASVPIEPEPPTAEHTVGEGHETASSQLCGKEPRVGLGVLSIVHVVPFQLSANVACLPAPIAVVMVLLCAPTAVHDVGEGHDTPASEISDNAPAGLGVGWIDQVLPFQRSANVSSVPAPFV